MKYIKCIPEDVLTLFYYSCSISIAMLALTTIIFASYNERIIYKIEKILLDIDNVNNAEVNKKLKQLSILLTKNSTYQSTLIILLFIMFLAVLLWTVVLLNKILNSGNVLQDLFILFSGLLVIASIIIIPIILMMLNRNKFIKLKKGAYKIEDLLFFLGKYTQINYHILFLSNINPFINITLFNKEEMNVNINQNLRVYNLNYIVEMNSQEKEECILNFSMSSIESVKYKVKSVSNNVNNYQGLFTELSTYSFNYLHVFEKDKYLCSLNLEKKIENNTIRYSAIKICEKSLLDSIKNEIVNENHLKLKSSNKNYSLIKS